MSATRLKVKFPTVDAYRAGTAMDFPDAHVPVHSEHRRFLVLEPAPAAAAGAVRRAANTLRLKYGATVVEDFQYTPD